MYVYLWEYRVHAGSADAFVERYGPEGDWVRLFRGASGYVGTELLRDRRDPQRFVTIDTWASRRHHRSFRDEFAGAFEELDRRCEALTEWERHLGDFAAVRPAPTGRPEHDD